MQLGPSNTSRICRPEATNSQETARMRHLRSFWFFAEPATQALLSRSEAFSSEVTTGLLADQDGPKSQLSSGSSTCGLVASASAAEGTSRRPRERSSARQLDGVEAGLHSLLISTGRSQLLRHDSACKAVFVDSSFRLPELSNPTLRILREKAGREQPDLTCPLVLGDQSCIVWRSWEYACRRP